MKKKRKQYTSQEKVTILKRHLVDNIAVSDLCDEHELHPNVFYRWQTQFFEGGAAVFEPESSRELGRLCMGRSTSRSASAMSRLFRSAPKSAIP